jgi:hypothetical protein
MGQKGVLKSIFTPKGIRRDEVVKQVYICVLFDLSEEKKKLLENPDNSRLLMTYIHQYLPNSFCQDYADYLMDMGSNNMEGAMEQLLHDKQHIETNIVTHIYEVIANTKLGINAKQNQHRRVVSY